MVEDNVNGMFEILGGIFVLMNVIRLHKDKSVRGVSVIATAYFMLWGYWNLVYYPSLEQWWSAAGSLSVALINTVWLGQMVYYLRKERHAITKGHKP